MSTTTRLSCLMVLVSASLAACGAVPEGPSGGGGVVAETRLALTTVPADVQCLKVNIGVANQTLTQSITLTTGSSTTSVNLGQLPAGSATFTGSGFGVACASVTGTTTANWIADPAFANLSPGVITTVSMTFRRNQAVTANVNFLESVSAIFTGLNATYARIGNGLVKEWGSSGDSLGSLTTPTAVGTNFSQVVQVTGGNNFACARKSDQSVWCWGNNTSGQLGPNAAVGAVVTTPVQVGTLFNDISAGLFHVCGVSNTTTHCWGNNDSGQLGDGSTTSSSTPHPISSGPATGRIFSGANHSCAVDSFGGLSCWGLNTSGQLGDGTTTNRVLPTAISGVSDIVDMALGSSHTCTLRADGQVRCWGGNGFGQLGDGTNMGRLTPTVSGLTDATQLAAGSLHTCARRLNGSISCWGNGSEIGDGIGLSTSVPLPITSLGTNVVAVRAHNGRHTCAEMADRTVRCWGVNGSGQIGDGTFQFASRPTPVLLQ